MPRIGAYSGADLMVGAKANVMARGDGVVMLASSNLLANPDFRNFDGAGRPTDWVLGAPDRPDGHHDYARRLTSTNAQGGHVQLRDTHLTRQTDAKLPLDAPAQNYARPLLPGAPPPEVGKRARVAPPAEIDVRVVAKSGVDGFPASPSSRPLRLSYAWIIGPNPMTSPMITDAAPRIDVVLGQGQRMLAYVPDEIPEGVSGIAWLAGYEGDLYVQKRTDLRHASPETVPLDGPFRRGKPHTENRTGARSEEHGPPQVKRVRTKASLKPMRTRLSYRLVFPSGISASQQETRVIEINNTQHGEGLAWRPPPGAANEGARMWRPEFRGKDGKNYLLAARAIDRYAVIHDNDAENMKALKPSEDPRKRTDDAKVFGPDTPLEPPDVLGPVEMPPGRYQWRQTFTVGDEQSGPGPAVNLALRDAGLAAGGPATFVTDQMFRVSGPGVQKITNARNTEKGPNGGLDLDWETPALLGVAVDTTETGVIKVSDTSQSATLQFVRLAAPTPINPTRSYTLRTDLTVTRRVGGAVSLMVRMFAASVANPDAPGAEVFNRVVERIDALVAERVNATFGPRGSGADFVVPATARFIQLIFRNGGDAGVRDLDWRAEHIGLITGRVGHRKRWPLFLNLGGDNDVPDRRSPDAEDPALPYPPGAYCRVVQNPTDGPRLPGATVLFEHGFENGTHGPYAHTSTADAVSEITADAALEGGLGMRVAKTTAGAAGGTPARGYVTATHTGRASVARRVRFRFREMPSAGTTGILRIGRTGTLGDYLAEVNLASTGLLSVQARNGATSQTATVLTGVLPGHRLTIELLCEGAGTASGRVEVNVKKGGPGSRNAARQTVLSGLDWTTHPIARAHSGVLGAPSEATFEIHADGILDTAAGEREGVALPGNYVEYWAPEGTPYSEDNLLSGKRVPIDQLTDYCLSAWVGTENVVEPASPLATVVLDADGNLLQTNASPCPDLKGDNSWARRWVSFTTPPGAAYLEFVGGPVADGLIRVMAPQLNAGTAPAPYANTNAFSGSFTVPFDTALPAGNPSPIVGATVGWKRARAVVTHEEDANGVPLTGVTTEFRAADSPEALRLAAWHPTLTALLDAVGQRRHFEMRTNLSTTDATRSPEVRAVFLDLERQPPVLLRPDGSEFASGVVITDYGVPEEDDAVIEREYADFSVGHEDLSAGRGTPPRRMALSLACWRDSVRAEIRRLRREGEPFVAEIHGTRYELRLSSAPEWEHDRSARTPMPNRGDRDGFWRHVADDVEAVILDEELL